MSARWLSEFLGVKHATVLDRLHNSHGMRPDHLKWISYQLTNHLSAARVKECRKLLTALEAAQRQNFQTLVTGDMSYFRLEYSHAMKWYVCPNDAPPRVRTTIACRKFMLTIKQGVTCFYMVDLMTTQKAFNSECFIKQITMPLVDKIYPEGRHQRDPRVQGHLNNCCVHFSK
jgi:hypothetical protein